MEEDHREIAQLQWVEAGQVRQNILKKVTELKHGRGGSINYTSRLEEIENLMKEFRLGCMQVTFRDFEYATKVDVENSLWQAHTSLNGEYRSILNRLGAQNQVVQKRKVDKLYRDFLKTSGFFYRGYIQRLAGRFCIPELRQAAEGLGLDSAQTASREFTPPSPLRAMVVSACYTTLVRLGDLSRYRSNASDKLSQANFDTALAYYGLANTLEPDDGSCHHQMAVLHQLKSQQLEIIYYFHRSIAIAKPYKLGPTNLERGFKTLESQAASRHGAPKSPSETMIAWFLRLHAAYYHGEVFQAQAELEKEVLHRLDLAVKAEGNDQLVLRMVLINMAAYDIAIDKVKANWTLNGSRSCQNLLGFNIRTTIVLIRYLKVALKDRAAAEAGDASDAKAKGAADFPPSMEKLLALFRIYIAWIYVIRADFAQYQEYLEPHISEVYRLLADTLTLLMPYVNSNKDVANSKYLLPEDVEAVGLKPLADRRLTLFLNVEILQGITPPKSRKTLKPRKEVFGRQFKSQTECIWRIRDIICCGIYLAGSGKFPLAMAQAEDGTECWYYADDTTTETPLDEAAMTVTLAKLKLNVYRTFAPDAEAGRGSYTSLADLNSSELSFPSGILQPQPQQLQPSQTQSAVDHGEELVETGQGQFLDSDLTGDSDMVDMVNKLVTIDDDDEAEDEDKLDIRPKSGEFRASPSYGMHSATANDIFGGLSTSSSTHPSGAPSKIIPNLPWYSYAPAANTVVNRPSSVINGPGELGTSGVAGYNAPIVTPTRPAFDQHASIPNTRGYSLAHPGSGSSSPYENQSAAAATAAKYSAPGARTYSNTGSPDITSPQRLSALENLSAQLTAQYGSGAANVPRYGGGSILNPQSPDFSVRTAKPQPSARVHGRGTSGSSSLFTEKINNNSKASPRSSVVYGEQRRVSGNPVAAYSEDSVAANFGGRLASPQRATGTFVSPTSPVGSAYGYRRPTPLSSPFAPANHGGYASAQEQYPATYSAAPESSASLAFSTPNTLWTGTPAQQFNARSLWHGVPAMEAQAPPGTDDSNGNFFDTTTAFGRTGPTNPDSDPASYRNTVKNMAGGEQAAAYDQAVLQSALSDNSNKPRTK